MQRMAVIVDEQNSGDPQYQPMAPLYTGTAFQAACILLPKVDRSPAATLSPFFTR